MAIVGVAKTAFRTGSHAVPVRRGGAPRPLYVTSAGIPADCAAAWTRSPGRGTATLLDDG
jgi:hypothetical protein